MIKSFTRNDLLSTVDHEKWGFFPGYEIKWDEWEEGEDEEEKQEREKERERNG